MRIVLFICLLFLLSCKPEYREVRIVRVEFSNGDVDTLENPYIKSGHIWDGTDRKVDYHETIDIKRIKNK